MSTPKTPRSAKKAPKKVSKATTKTKATKATKATTKAKVAASDDLAVWYYPAAAACHSVLATHERYGAHKGAASWKDGSLEAWVLVLAAREGAAAFGHCHEYDPPPEPEDWQGWQEEADRLFALAGLDASFAGLKDRTVIKVSPYHVSLAVDPKHPMFDRRCKLPPDRGLAESILSCGEVFEVLQVTPYEDEDGVTRLYSGSGSRRTQATRLANDITLRNWVHSLRVARDEERPRFGPPMLVRALDAKIFLEGKSRHAAATVANQLRRAEDIVREADSVETLLGAGYPIEEVARMLGKSERTIANLHALLKLDTTLRDQLASDQLPAVCAYRLAQEQSKKKQRDAAKATVAYKSSGARRDAIDAFLAGKPLPDQATKKRTISPKAIAAAAEHLSGVELAAEHQALAGLLRALAGDAEALEALPEVVREAFIDPGRSARLKARWNAAGYDDEARRAWMEVSPDIEPYQAKRCEAAGILREHLRMKPSKELVARLMEEEGYDAAFLENDTLGDLLFDYTIDEEQLLEDVRLQTPQTDLEEYVKDKAAAE